MHEGRAKVAPKLAQSARHACVATAYGRPMFAGAFLGQLTTIVGLMAGSIAVGGFLGQAWPSLSVQADPKIRRATTTGGLIGLLAALLAIVLSSVFVNLLS